MRRGRRPCDSAARRSCAHDAVSARGNIVRAPSAGRRAARVRAPAPAVTSSKLVHNRSSCGAVAGHAPRGRESPAPRATRGSASGSRRERGPRCATSARPIAAAVGSTRGLVAREARDQKMTADLARTPARAWTSKRRHAIQVDRRAATRVSAIGPAAAAPTPIRIRRGARSPRRADCAAPLRAAPPSSASRRRRGPRRVRAFSTAARDLRRVGQAEVSSHRGPPARHPRQNASRLAPRRPWPQHPPHQVGKNVPRQARPSIGPRTVGSARRRTTPPNAPPTCRRLASHETSSAGNRSFTGTRGLRPRPHRHRRHASVGPTSRSHAAKNPAPCLARAGEWVCHPQRKYRLLTNCTREFSQGRISERH